MRVRKIRICGDTAYITLTRGYEAIIDAADAPLAECHNWHVFVSPHTAYARRWTKQGEGVGKKMVHLHRLILSAPESMDVDHINSNGLDNRRVNLRLATPSQNMHGQRISKANTSGFKGVSWSKSQKRWRADIKLCRKRICLGFFKCIDMARDAYAEASKRMHGSFGRSY